MNKILILAVLLMLPLALAGSTKTCLDDNTLEYNMTKTIVENSDTTVLSINENITCSLGCLNGACIESSNNISITYVVGIGILSFIFAYLASTVKSEDWPLQIIFFMKNLQMRNNERKNI